MRKWTCLLIIFLTAALATPTRAADPGARFSDMPGHWAEVLVRQAVGRGYVSGYPDGTFRPDAPVTRAEAVKLLAVAGNLGLIQDGNVTFEDTPATHWVLAQGYLNAALYYGMVTYDVPDRNFRPDAPATRLEVLTFALGLLGGTYAHPPESAAPLPFTDPIAEGARPWIKEGLDLGLVQGYPDGTFRPDGTVTRAEAVAIVERTIRQMEAGTDADLHLVLNGKPVPDAVLAVRDGYVYAPGNAIYMDPAAFDWREIHSQGVGGSTSNERFILDTGILSAVAGDRSVQLYQPSGESIFVELPTPPYVRFGQAMIPVAPVGGTGTIPYATTVHDAASGTVSVTFTADWPGNRLATRPEQVRFEPYQPLTLVAGQRLPLRVPNLKDQNGYYVKDRQKLPVAFSVAPDSPLRLSAGPEGPAVTSFTAGPDNDWHVPDLMVLPDPAEGVYHLTIGAPPYGAADSEIIVVDPLPRQLVLEPVGTWKAGQEATLRLKVLDRFGRLTDFSFTYYNYSNVRSSDRNPVVTITGPDGQPVEAKPVLQVPFHSTVDYYYVIVHGTGTFTFIPPAPGSYQIKAVAQFDGKTDVVTEATFAVSP